MVRSAAMRSFALGHALLAITLLWIVVAIVLPNFDEVVRTEAFRFASVVATLVSSTLLAPVAWFWPPRGDRAAFWLIGTVPALVFLVLLLPPLGRSVFISMNFGELLSSLMSLLAAAVVIAAGVLAYLEAKAQRPAVSATFRDRRFRAASGVLAVLVLAPIALFIGRVLQRRESVPGQVGAPVGSGRPARTPGEGVRVETVAQGNLTLPTGTLSISYLEIQQTGRASVAHDAGFVYVLEGEQELIIGTSAPQLLRAGQAAFVPAAVLHEHVAAGTSPVRWLFVGARSADVGDKEFKFAQQRIAYRSTELPSLPAGANTEVLMLFVLERDAETRRALTGGVMALFALEGEIDVLAGTGDKSIRKGEGSNLLQGSPFTIVNRAQGESRVLAFFLMPEGRVALLAP